jgi:hypothetical protein
LVTALRPGTAPVTEPTSGTALVMPLTAPVTEPGPEALPLTELLPEALVPVLGPEALPLPELVPEVLVPELGPAAAVFELEPEALVSANRAGTALVALLRSGIAPETEPRPGSVLDVLLEELVAPLALDELPPVVPEELQGAPRAAATAEIPGPARGRPAASQRAPAVADAPPASCVPPLTDAVGVSAPDCASAGAARPTARMPDAATPPSKIRQLYTKYSTSSWVMELAAIWEFTRPGRTLAPFQLGVWKLTLAEI